jgi:hypothetical protein
VPVCGNPVIKIFFLFKTYLLIYIILIPTIHRKC